MAESLLSVVRAGTIAVETKAPPRRPSKNQIKSNPSHLLFPRAPQNLAVNVSAAPDHWLCAHPIVCLSILLFCIRRPRHRSSRYQHILFFSSCSNPHNQNQNHAQNERRGICEPIQVRGDPKLRRRREGQGDRLCQLLLLLCPAVPPEADARRSQSYGQLSSGHHGQRRGVQGQGERSRGCYSPPNFNDERHLLIARHVRFHFSHPTSQQIILSSEPPIVRS